LERLYTIARMSFRVLIVGDHFRDYARLRDTLGAVLARRLPNVEILTTGGPSVPALAASYARSRGLRFAALVPDHERHPGDAVERRDEFLVAEADAAVVVGEATGRAWELAKGIGAKGGRVVLLSAQAAEKRGPAGVADAVDDWRRTRGLPD
jgi:hypothetical protein